jgi:hypothetical protein
MANRKSVPAEPLSFVDLLRAVVWLHHSDERAGRWFVAHRAQVEATAAGAPCQYGKDGRKQAVELLKAFGR